MKRKYLIAAGIGVFGLVALTGIGRSIAGVATKPSPITAATAAPGSTPDTGASSYPAASSSTDTSVPSSDTTPAPGAHALDQILADGWAHALFQNHRPRVCRATDAGQYVALTFDDGPKPWGTPLILSALEQRHAHATFFVVGKQCARFPSLVARIALDGDEIGNHTYDHFRLPTIPVSRVAEELERNRILIHQITGETTYLFRPPGGRLNPRSQTVVDSLGYTTVFWTLDAADLARDMDPDRVYHRVVDHVRNGDIILMHNGDPNSVSALPRIIDTLAQKGYQFVTVSELMRLTGASPQDQPQAPGNDTDDEE
ncbi:MAG TPA: polysaccharide deacetylase family protein [Armatimonadota bacterium]|nr:polysaccharide deacetylase family protein [Armatimonadota bacterium]